MFCPLPPPIRCIVSRRAPLSAPYPFAAFYISYCVFTLHPQHYLSYPISSSSLVLSIKHNLPVQVRPAPSVHPSVVFSQTVHHHLFRPRLLPSLVLDHPQTPAPKTLFFLGRIHFALVGRHAVEFTDLSILVIRWRRVGDTEGLRWTIQMVVGQAALKGKTVWCAGRMRRRFMKAKTGPVTGWVMDKVGGYGLASASNRAGQARMEWNSGRKAHVWERTGQR